ncbi:MAG TPA: fumarylacetoacetate hydrolase family protein [Anaerolineae bacterium]|nr:fumarylacetoacetate hydrolase family protein [Anaerolineae bacterium]HQH38741.1 fumarylacetoacetate hydrolase family protein [Anaerolineae bacterium]
MTKNDKLEGEKTISRLGRIDDHGKSVWVWFEDDQVYRLEGNPYNGGGRGPHMGTLATVTLLPPVCPTKIICVGRNYVAHAAEHGAEVPAEPLLFLKPPSSVIGPGMNIVLPTLSQRVEHEAELALVIGKRCRNVAPEEAWDYVLGITCGNDVTARDLQYKDGQWTRGKSFDTFCPIGPWVVTGLRSADVADLGVVCRVNGEVRQTGRTSQMVFSPTTLMAYAARVMTLEPGDVFLTGTPAGVGPLTPGDEVEVEIEGIGILRNPVL